MKMKEMLFVVKVFVTVPKSLENNVGELEIRGRMETIETTSLLKSAHPRRHAPTLAPMKNQLLK